MNQQWNGFGSLNLSGVEAEKGRSSLPPGPHICKITEAKVEPTANGNGMKLLITLTNSVGSVRDFINVANVNPQAVEIGLKRLKHLLIAARHPNPDHPGDVGTLVGLSVGVNVQQGETWKDQNGTTRPGGGEPRRFEPYFDVDALADQPPAPPVQAVPQQSTQSQQGYKAPF